MSALDLEILVKELKRIGQKALKDKDYQFHDCFYKGERRLRWIGKCDDLEIMFRWTT